MRRKGGRHGREINSKTSGVKNQKLVESSGRVRGLDKKVLVVKGIYFLESSST